MSSPARTALQNMRRSPYQSLAAIMVLTITFFIGYVFLMLLIGSEMVIRYFETQPQIMAFFEVKADQSAVAAAETLMKSKDDVKEVKVISKEEALQIYQQDNQDDPALLQLVPADILPASIEVSATSIESLGQIETDLQQIEGIEEVVYQKDIVDSLARWTRSLRVVGTGIISLLTITSVLVIFVITGMKVAMKKNAIRVMQLIGASRWYIKAPFVFEGIYYGILASLFGWVLSYVTLLYSTPWLINFLGEIPLLPVPPVFMAVLLGAGALGGMIIGGFSSLFSAQRLLK